MVGITKLELDNDYHFRAERMIMASGINLDVHSESRPGLLREEVRLHYHSFFMTPILETRWSGIIPTLIPIVSTDKVVIAGSAFGFSIPFISSLTGALVIGVDISDYIDTAKTTSEDVDLVEAISSVGLDETVGRGLAIFNFYSNPLSRTVSVVLKEDMLSNQSRNKIRQALGNSAPDYILTEDMIQDMTDAEILTWKTELDKLTTTTVIHIISRETTRTMEQLNLLTNHLIINSGDNFRVVGE